MDNTRQWSFKQALVQQHPKPTHKIYHSLLLAHGFAVSSKAQCKGNVRMYLLLYILVITRHRFYSNYAKVYLLHSIQGAVFLLQKTGFYILS
jgi:hypothetical protein